MYLELKRSRHFFLLVDGRLLRFILNALNNFSDGNLNAYFYYVSLVLKTKGGIGVKNIF